MRFFALLEKLSPQSAATIVFNKKGNILILQRGHTAPWMPLRWNLPGGMVDAGESPLQAAKREAFEEARIKPKNMKFVKVIKDDQYDLHIFTGNVSSDKVNLGDMENIKYAWIQPSDLDKYNFVPYTKEILTNAFGVVQESLTEASNEYYHGTKEDFTDLKKNKDGFIWLALNKDIAMSYAQDRYWVKNPDRVLKVTLKPNAKILDLTDMTNKHAKEIRDKVAFKRGMMSGVSTMTDKEWKDFADFGVIESNPWIRGWLISKRYDGVKVKDATSIRGKKHDSIALFNTKPIVNTEIDSVIKEAKKITDLKGNKIVAPREFYRAEDPNYKGARITTGDKYWDSKLFVSSNESGARMYGDVIQTYQAKPNTKIAYQGTKEFNQLKKGVDDSRFLAWASTVVKNAEKAGFDAVWFKQQSDVGTVVINPKAFTPI